jgi:hypothetical protein
MAASGFTPISLYYSTTASAVPTSGNLANGELGLNIADMKLYAKNSAGTVTLLASNAGASGSVTSVSGTGTVNGLTLTGTVTTSGSLTLGGTLSLVSPPPIGSTTPNTGSFTTISGTTVQVGNGISYFNNTDSNIMLRVGVGITSTLGTGEGLEFSYTAPQAKILSYNRATSAYKSLFLDSLTTTLGVSGSVIATVSSTGLAVTGAISATTGVTAGATSGYTAGNLFAYDASGVVRIGGNAGSTLRLISNGVTSLEFGSAGQFGIGGATYGNVGEVLTSGGASAAPTWAAAGGGGTTNGKLYFYSSFN